MSDGEYIAVLEVEIDEAKKVIACREMIDGKTVILLQYAKADWLCDESGNKKQRGVTSLGRYPSLLSKERAIG